VIICDPSVLNIVSQEKIQLTPPAQQRVMSVKFFLSITEKSKLKEGFEGGNKLAEES